MNLVIFTPAIKSSAIGRMAALVTNTLATQEHKVTVVRTENENLLCCETHNFGVPVLAWNDSATLSNVVQSADTFVYQIGDNYEFHRGALCWLPKLPGLVCLHDFYLGNLFYRWAQSSRAEADAVLRAWYGEEILNQFFCFSNRDAFIEGTHDVAPMTEWICSMAHGVITHSGWGCERVLNSCPGPVRVVPLAYNALDALSDDCKNESDSESLRISTVGYVNPSKRVGSVIRAIGSSLLLRQRVSYHLVGHAKPLVVDRLSTLAEKHGVKLVISLDVNDAGLARAIAESDVITCLRWPSLEAASPSTIEAMLHGKPVIVTDTGFYSELPDSCVFKICPENEVEDLQSILELLIIDQGRRNMVAAQGQEWASRTFTAENYARELIDTVEETIKARPTLKAINYFCNVMHQWSACSEVLTIEEIMNPLRIFGNCASSALDP